MYVPIWVIIAIPVLLIGTAVFLYTGGYFNPRRHPRKVPREFDCRRFYHESECLLLPMLATTVGEGVYKEILSEIEQDIREYYERYKEINGENHTKLEWTETYDKYVMEMFDKNNLSRFKWWALPRVVQKLDKKINDGVVYRSFDEGKNLLKHLSADLEELRKKYDNVLLNLSLYVKQNG